jgi:hypothetical protein
MMIFKPKMISCTKVTGEPFSFSRRSAEGERYRAYRNFQAKGLLADRTLESFIEAREKTKRKEGVTVKRYYILKNVFNNKERTNV